MLNQENSSIRGQVGIGSLVVFLAVVFVAFVGSILITLGVLAWVFGVELSLARVGMVIVGMLIVFVLGTIVSLRVAMSKSQMDEEEKEKVKEALDEAGAEATPFDEDSEDQEQ